MGRLEDLVYSSRLVHDQEPKRFLIIRLCLREIPVHPMPENEKVVVLKNASNKPNY